MELSEDFKQKIADKEWRLNNLYYIKDSEGNKIPFVMNDAQSEFYHNMHSRNIILKARQLGFSTFIKIYELDSNYFADGVSDSGKFEIMPPASADLAKAYNSPLYKYNKKLQNKTRKYIQKSGNNMIGFELCVNYGINFGM